MKGMDHQSSASQSGKKMIKDQEAPHSTEDDEFNFSKDDPVSPKSERPSFGQDTMPSLDGINLNKKSSLIMDEDAQYADLCEFLRDIGKGIKPDFSGPLFVHKLSDEEMRTAKPPAGNYC